MVLIAESSFSRVNFTGVDGLFYTFHEVTLRSIPIMVNQCKQSVIYLARHVIYCFSRTVPVSLDRLIKIQPNEFKLNLCKCKCMELLFNMPELKDIFEMFFVCCLIVRILADEKLTY